MLTVEPSFKRFLSGLMVPETCEPGTEETAAASLSGSFCPYRETYSVSERVHPR